MDLHPVIEKLLEKMNSGQGFAGMGSSIQTMSCLDDDDLSANEIVETILRDAALTGKLLRLANSSNRTSRNISTIDQAISVIGLNTVKTVTISLAMLNSMGNSPQSKQLHAEIASAYFCGALCAQITRINGVRYNAQEAQICGLLQNLGRMMAIYYLFDEIDQCQALRADQNLSLDVAFSRTVGVTFEQIGEAIARFWKLPDALLNSLNPEPLKASPRAVTSALDWDVCCSMFVRRVTDALFREPENREKNLINEAIQFFRTALQLREDDTNQLIKRVWDDTAALLPSIGFPSSLEDAQAVLRKANERVLDTLSAQDSLASHAGADGGKAPIEVIQQMLRLIHNECKFDLTLLLLPNGSTSLIAIAGVGRKASAVTTLFRCQGQKPDIFRLIAAKKVDMYVGDTNSPSFRQFIPDWYTTGIGAGSFMLMSLMYEGQFVGMLYGDYTAQKVVVAEEAKQEKVKDWRLQMATALNQNKKPSAAKIGNEQVRS